MRTISKQELKAILDKHGKWLRKEESGERADLRSADLRSADLRSANLSDANLSDANLSNADLRYANLSNADLRSTRLENKTLLTFSFGRHTATFMSEDSITIGCHTHPVAHWVEHFVAIGTKEGYTPAQIKEYGRFIKGCAKIQASLNKK